MSSTTNQHLLTDYPTPEALVALQKQDDTLQIWAVITEYLVEKGTNLEQLIADMYDGKAMDNPDNIKKIKGVYVAGFMELAPVAGPLEKITDSTLTTLFPVELAHLVDSTTELYNVTTEYLVKKGTNIQTMLVDSLEGKFNDLDPKMSPDCKGICPIADITKVA